ncbi:MAG TPA: trypsin-like peptidase domain-containing protein [Phycisphaerales bacterium]|nr:trypsin-like peptidase domain-containing protein [Phycisphaerales bacterium]
MITRATSKLLAVLLALLGLGPAACGQNSTPTQPKPSAPSVTRTATPARPSPDAASAEDIAFAKRLSNAFKSVAHNVEPSVVHITQRNRITQRNIWGEVVRSGITDTGMGSGFIVSTDGYIVTNNHVITSRDRAAEQISVRLFDGREVDARLVGRDELTDLAVLQIDAKELPQGISPVTFGDSDVLEVGEWVVAIGSPFGLSNTVTAGIVSAKGRSITPRETGRVHEDFIQTDAAINPGNSGGPLLNLQGEVVGVNSAIASRSGGYQGIGFAIPSNIAKAVLDNIVAHGRVVRGWMGVDLADLANGVGVQSVQEDSPADKAGLRAGDIITKYQGKTVNEPRLRNAIALTAPGTKAPIEILRDGQALSTVVTIGDLNAALGNTDVPQLGARVRTLTRDIAQALRVNRNRGVVVMEVDDGSRAHAAGFEPGDVIVGYRQGATERTIGTAEEFTNLCARADFASGLQLNVIRNNQGFLQRGYLVVQDQ